MANVLIVNNDIDTMSLMKRWLERKQYQVKYTENPEQVSSIIEEFNPDVIIVDVLQKKVLEEIKKPVEVPVILMTGYTKRSEDNSLPVDDVIEKPFNLPVLEKKIQKLVSK